MPPTPDRGQIYDLFHEVVNMAPGELRSWLATRESRGVGFTRPGEAESVGHASGQRILDILGKPRDSLDEADYAHMRKVIGFVRRHRAQEPANRVTSRWRYSLMNWGHDPLKD
jgi:hypothetical protein